MAWTTAILPSPARADEPRRFTPTTCVVDGAARVAFIPREAEYLLWTVEKRLPACYRAVTAYEQLDRAQTMLVRTTTTALAVQGSILTDQRALTDAWRNAANTPRPSDGAPWWLVGVIAVGSAALGAAVAAAVAGGGSS